MKNKFSSQKLAQKAAEYAWQKKAEEIVMIDLRGISPVADFFIICTAASDLHAKAVADGIKVSLKEEGEKPLHVEGMNHPHWVLLDYVNVVVHIFLEEKRSFYNLEGLWGDAPRISVNNENGKLENKK